MAMVLEQSKYGSLTKRESLKNTLTVISSSDTAGVSFFSLKKIKYPPAAAIEITTNKINNLLIGYWLIFFIFSTQGSNRSPGNYRACRRFHLQNSPGLFFSCRNLP